MNKKVMTIFFALALIPIAGCDVSNLLDDGSNYDSTDDYYPENDPTTYSPPQYTPPTPPQCAVSAGCDGLIYSNHEESANVTVTIQNSSPDETAFNVRCVVTATNGNSTLAQNSLDFDPIDAGRSQSMSTRIDIFNPPNICRDFECVVTWSDNQGNNYQAQTTARVYF